jgi:hypothetical protein
LQKVAGHLNALGLNDVKLLGRQQRAQRIGIHWSGIAQRHIRQRRYQRRPGAVRQSSSDRAAHRHHPTDALKRRERLLGRNIRREREACHIVTRG